MAQTAAATTNQDNTRLARPVGRPQAFNQRTVRNTRDYINHTTDEIPTMAGLAVYLGVSTQTLYKWIEKKIDPDFVDAVHRMKDERERRLINGGLNSKWNSNIVKLILTTNHGYSENNQAHSGVTVNVSRDGVTVQAGSNRVQVDSESSGATAKSVPGNVIEHESSGK